MMKIDSVESKRDNVLTFSLKGSDLKFANMLRRTIISMIPTITIDKVVFYENSSTLFDEYISHRLGLVPLETPEKIPKDTEFVFVLDERGPKKVYSGSLKPVNHSVKPALEDIPIITLLEDQSLRLEAKAIPGDGRVHAKFQPGFASYRVDDKTGDIRFRVESFYQMTPKQLLSRALKVLDSEVSSLEKAVDKIK